ncbi:MAG: DUF1214 domain-containing protein [Rhodopila sp.]
MARTGCFTAWCLRHDGEPLCRDRHQANRPARLRRDSRRSVELYLQAGSPGKDKEANWLPAPKGKFNLVLRIYAPRKTPPSILDGSWTPPPVKRAQ